MRDYVLMPKVRRLAGFKCRASIRMPMYY